MVRKEKHSYLFGYIEITNNRFMKYVSSTKHGLILGDDLFPGKMYGICPFKHAVRGGDYWMCVYLLVENGSVTYTSKP